MVEGALYSCALLGGFAVGARVSLLWQHTRLMRNVSKCSVFAVWLALLLVLLVAAGLFYVHVCPINPNRLVMSDNNLNNSSWLLAASDYSRKISVHAFVV